jgi:hypothetical protein
VICNFALGGAGSWGGFKWTSNGALSAQLYIDVNAAVMRFGIGGHDNDMAMTTAALFATTTNTMDLGTGSLRWKTVYSVNADDISSDERDKIRVTDRNLCLGIEFIRAIESWVYRRKDDSSGILHFGVSAQQVRGVLDRFDIPAGSLITYDPDSDRYGARYDEFIAPLIASVQTLDQRIAALESRFR